MKKGLSFFAGLTMTVSSYATPYDGSTLSKVTQTISQTTANIALLCDELSAHKQWITKGDNYSPISFISKNFYTPEKKKELELYILERNYSSLAIPPLSRLGNRDYYLVFTEGEKTIMLAFFTDYWKAYNHRYFLLHPILPRPQLYHQDEKTIIGTVLHIYNADVSSPCSTNEQPYLEIEDNGADGMQKTNPFLKNWHPAIQERVVIHKPEGSVLLVDEDSLSEERTRFNWRYAHQLLQIEKRLHQSLEKINK